MAFQSHTVSLILGTRESGTICFLHVLAGDLISERAKQNDEG